MPHVVVYNLRADRDFEEKRTETIESAITENILSFRELQLQEKDISYTFVYDPTVTSDDIPTVVIVELFEKPERTEKARDLLARVIRAAIISTIQWRNLGKVKVAVRGFAPDKDSFFSGE